MAMNVIDAPILSADIEEKEGFLGFELLLFKRLNQQPTLLKEFLCDGLKKKEDLGANFDSSTDYSSLLTLETLENLGIGVSGVLLHCHSLI